MKRTVITLAMIGFVLALFVTAGGQPLWAADPIKVGVILSITGRGGFLGTPQKEAFTVVTDDINKKGGVLGRQIELFIEDDQSNPTNAATAATKLIRDKKVDILVGTSLVVSGMAMIPIAEQEKVPTITITPVTVPFHKWVFLGTVDDNRLAQKILAFTATTLGKKKIAVLYSSDLHGNTGYEAVSQNVKKYAGASIVASEKFEPADTNMIPQLTKVKAANPDVIMLFANAGPASVVAKNYQQLGITTPVIGSHGMPTAEFLKLAGKIAEDDKWVIFGLNTNVADKLAADDPWRKNVFEPFRKLLREKTGKPEAVVTPFHPGGHDAMNIIVQALKMAGKTEKTAVRDAIEKVKFMGLLGKFECSPTDHFCQDGDSIIPLTVKGGEFWPFKK